MMPENNPLSAWFAKSEPDVWCMFASELCITHPDCSAALHWVVLHPNCDKATAQCIYMASARGWRTPPDLGWKVVSSYRLTKQHDGPDPGLFATITQRWNARSFIDSGIESYAALEQDAKHYRPDISYWPIDASIAVRITGRRQASPKELLSSKLLFVLRSHVLSHSNSVSDVVEANLSNELDNKIAVAIERQSVDRTVAAAAAAISAGYDSPKDLRNILQWEWNIHTSAMVEEFIATHMHEQKMLDSMVAVALEGWGDSGQSAARYITQFSPEMLSRVRPELEKLSQSDPGNFGDIFPEQAKKALAMIDGK